jgi:hypothetical protein
MDDHYRPPGHPCRYLHEFRMIRVDEVEFSTADVRRIEKQVEFLEQKVAENHWPKLAIRTFVTIVAVVAVFTVTRSVLWSFIPLIAGAVWAGAVFDGISTQKMQRDWLAYERTRLGTRRKTVIGVEDCDYIEYGEFEDEGVLYLFWDNAGNWLMLEGQEYYPTDKFPSSSFRLSYDSQGALLEIVGDAPFHKPRQRRDAAVKTEQELFFGGIDHALVQANSEDDAIAKLKTLAERSTK